MLDLTGDSAGDIKFGTNCHTGLSDLTVMVNPSGINSSTAGADFSAQYIGEFGKQLEILLAAHTVTAGNHNGSTLEVDFGFLDMTVNHLNHIIFG